MVGEIRPGVTCGGDSCVAAAIALTQPSTVVTAPLTLTGAAGTTPTTSPSAAPTTSPTTSPTATASPTPTPTPTDAASTGSKGGKKNNGKGNAGQLAHTGAADANITAALAVLALQVGLVLAVRARSRRTRPRHAA